MEKDVKRLIRASLKSKALSFSKKSYLCLPNFIIIGAAKSATTTLSALLQQHPDVFMSKPKEPKFFGRNYNKGWIWYASRFAAGQNMLLRGEGSTMYTSFLATYRFTPALMYQYLPDLKLVYIVRDPLDRIVSQWRHHRGRNPGCADFAELMQDRDLRRRIVGCSMYYKQLSRFRAFYPDSQIHCMTFEDLLSSPRQVLKGMLKFLGAKPRLKRMLGSQGCLPRENEAGAKGRGHVKKPVWTPGLRAKVLRQVRPDAKKMLHYMGKPSDYWEL